MIGNLSPYEFVNRQSAQGLLEGFGHQFARPHRQAGELGEVPKRCTVNDAAYHRGGVEAGSRNRQREQQSGEALREIGKPVVTIGNLVHRIAVPGWKAPQACRSVEATAHAARSGRDDAGRHCRTIRRAASASG